MSYQTVGSTIGCGDWDCLSEPTRRPPPRTRACGGSYKPLPRTTDRWQGCQGTPNGAPSFGKRFPFALSRHHFETGLACAYTLIRFEIIQCPEQMQRPRRLFQVGPASLIRGAKVRVRRPASGPDLVHRCAPAVVARDPRVRASGRPCDCARRQASAEMA